jgi:CRISPR-associated protein Csx17
VVTPWSGGSGFWPKDNTEGISAIEASNAERLASYRGVVHHCRALIRDLGLSEAPKEDAKAALLATLRATLPDDACRWLDGAVALTTDGPRYPPILGTGGNDGRLDISNNFMRRLVQAIGPEDASQDLLLLRCSPCPRRVSKKALSVSFHREQPGHQRRDRLRGRDTDS